MKRKPIIALAQIVYFDTEEKHNVVKIKKYIALAKKKNADIICFPETCIHKTDYMTFSHKLMKEIQEACRENSIWCIVTDSFIEKNEPYKVAVLIDRKGRIAGKYKKINLYDDYVKPGKRIGVFKTDFAKIGIAICWDLAFPELFANMRKQGAQIVFCPSKWCYEEEAYNKAHKKMELHLLRSLLISRSFENLFFVALCNPLTKSKDLISYSAIASPHRILKEIINEEGLIIAELNLNELKKFRKIYPNK